MVQVKQYNGTESLCVHKWLVSKSRYNLAEVHSLSAQFFNGKYEGALNEMK